MDAAAGQTLMDAPPARGTIVKTTVRPEAGITEWTLSNGATVVLKPTTLKEDQILFRAAAPGGTSLASDADFIPARVADDVIPAGGVGRFSAVTLDKMLAGKAVAVTPFINEIDEGMRGGSTPQDLETMFQLLYLRFTQPRADPTAFAAMQSQAQGLLANQMASPDVVFNQTHRRRAQPEQSRGGSPRRRRRWTSGISRSRWRSTRRASPTRATSRSSSSAASRPRRSSRSSRPTSPACRRRTRTRRGATSASRRPPGVVEKTIEKGIAPKSEVAIVFSGPFEYDDAHRLALRTMTLLLQSRLFDTIRQELGGTYSITATPDTQKFPRPEYRVRIDWTCDPARTATLVQRVFEEIAFVRATPLSPGQVALIREALLRDFEQNSQDNGYLLNQISRRYEDGERRGRARRLTTCRTRSRRSPATRFSRRRRPTSTPGTT